MTRSSVCTCKDKLSQEVKTTTHFISLLAGSLPATTSVFKGNARRSTSLILTRNWPESMFII